MYKSGHAAIRADPSPKAPKPKEERKEGEKPKRYVISLPNSLRNFGMHGP